MRLQFTLLLATVAAQRTVERAVITMSVHVDSERRTEVGTVAADLALIRPTPFVQQHMLLQALLASGTVVADATLEGA